MDRYPVTPIGKYYVRREPQGDEGDVVVLKGVTTEEPVGGGTCDLVVIEAAEFGSVPASWDSPSVTLTADDFVEEYTPQTDAERSLLALEQAANAQTATDENRISPWAYFHVPAKRARS